MSGQAHHSNIISASIFAASRFPLAKRCTSAGTNSLSTEQTPRSARSDRNHTEMNLCSTTRRCTGASRDHRLDKVHARRTT